MNRRFAVLLSFAILAIADPVNAQTFNNPVRIPTGQDPYSVFAVDLNGDGLADLLYGIPGVNSTPGAMHTFLAQPSGGYVEGPTLSMPVGVGACRPADINHDGKQDLVCINYQDECDSQIAVFLANGDGSFQTPMYSGPMHSSCLLSSFYPQLYTPADLNSDGSPDLTVGDTYNFEFFVLLGDGAGHFTVASTNLSNGVNGAALYAADLNGDGKPDLVSSTGPLVYLGNGNGTFGSEKSYGSFASCNLHDVESDGHPDGVCVGYLAQGSEYTGTNEIAILHNNGDGTFNTTPIASQMFGDPQGGNAAIWTPTDILDVNGDGIPDILAYSADGLSVLLGEPNLKFAQPVHYAAGNFGYVGATTSQVVDLNGDGYPDIVATGASGLYISYGNKAGAFTAPAVYPVANLLGSMTVADFNGDGTPDIAATGDESIELSIGKGDGTFQPPLALPVGSTSFAGATVNTNLGFNIAHGDFRGIGQQDILAIGTPSTYEYELYILFNNGDGTFSAPQLVPDSSTIFPNLENFAVADFNGDHRDDFLTTTTYPVSAKVELSNGDGTFHEVTTALPNQASGYVPFPAVADFNKDGKPDLLYVAGANANVLKGNGDGSFNPNAVVLPIPPYQGQSLQYQPLAVAAGDFDGDGNPDIAVLALVGPWTPPPSPYTNIATAVYVFYGNGDGTFSTPEIAASSRAVYDTIYTADVNKDGRDDLILENTGTEATGWPMPGNSVGVFLSGPRRLFGPEADYETGLRGVGAFVADVNRDGYPDLLISNSSYWDGGYTITYSNSVTELLNLGPQTNSGLQASNTVLTASSQSLTAGTSVTFTATVSGTSSTGSTPSGYVRFADQTGVETTVPLAATGTGSATAAFTTSRIVPGADTMGATYSGDTTFAPSFATVPLTVTGLPDTVTFTVTPNPVALGSAAALTVSVANPAGSSAAAPAGYIEFRDGSTIIGGPNTLSDGSTTIYVAFSTGGSHALSAWYSGDLTQVSNTATQTESVLISPNVSINTPSSITTAQVLSAVITVSGGNGNPTPTGSVNLAISTSQTGAGTSYGTGFLSQGSATINVPAGSLAASTYWLTVTYTPDAASSSTYLTSSVNGDYISVIVPPPTFTINGTAVTVVPGSTSGNTSTITVTPSGGFTGNVTLSASITSGPDGAQYPPTFSFGSTSPIGITGTSAGTATLTILTTAPTSAALSLPARHGGPRYIPGGAALACLLLFWIRPIRRGQRTILGMLALLLASATGLLACGGGGASGGAGGTTNPGTTAGTYTVTVSGASGTTTATGTITVVVQ